MTADTFNSMIAANEITSLLMAGIFDQSVEAITLRKHDAIVVLALIAGVMGILEQEVDKSLRH